MQLPRQRVACGLAVAFSLLLALLSASGAHAATVAAGSDQSCSISSAGALSCWGSDGGGGALGTGVDRSGYTADPQAVSGMGSDVSAVHLGLSDAGCAIKGGGAWCWGANSYGQLGDGTRTKRLAPVAVSGLGSGVSEISVATSVSCAVVNGGARCWGEGDDGRLGDGAATDRLTPVTPHFRAQGQHSHPPAEPTTPMDSGVTSVAAGWRHACVIWTGKVVCMGDNTNGQLGYGSFSYSIPYRYYGRPLESPPPGTPVEIVAGTDMNCVRMSNGSVWCWGYNNSGQLGRGTVDGESYNPQQVVGLDSGVTDIAASSSHVCAIKNGEAWCWGDGQVGKLGNNPPTAHGNDSGTPVRAGTLSGVTSIAVGSNHTCAIAGGERWCWGGNAHLELGTDAVESWSGVPVKASGATPKQPAAPKPPSSSKPPAGPAPAPAPVTVRPPAVVKPLVAVIAMRTTTKLNPAGIATLATIACPAGATCRASAPRTVSVAIRRRRFALRILGTGAIAGRRRAILRVQFSRGAARRLGRRSVRVAFTLTTTVNGVKSTRTVGSLVTGR